MTSKKISSQQKLGLSKQQPHETPSFMYLLDVYIVGNSDIVIDNKRGFPYMC